MDNFKNKKVVILGGACAFVTILFMAYLFVGYKYSSTVSAGTTIAKIDLSNKTEKEAIALLKEKLDAEIEKPLVFKMKDKSGTVLPKDLAITPDYEKTVKKLTSFTLNPKVLYERIKGNPNAVLAIKNTDAKLKQLALTKLQEEIGKPVVNAGIKFQDNKPVLTFAADGEGFYEKDLFAALSKEWFVEKEIELVSKKIHPEIDDKKAKEVFEKVANPLVSAPMTLKVEDVNAEISPELLASNAEFVVEKSDLVLKIKGEEVSIKLDEQLTEKVSKGQDARIVIENNAPQIIPSQKGKNVDPQKLSEKIQETASKKTERNFSLPLVEINPKLDTKAAEKLGVKEVISEYTIPIKGEPKRLNLIVGSEKINNTLLMPGDTFSYNDKLKPITAANGYVPGLAIVGASYGYTYGGGLCQLATTIFNAAFLGGMRDDEHKAHSEYFNDYPVGRDAAYWEELIDLKFTNDTPYGVVIQSYVDGWDLHVKLWSTKHFEVKTTTGDRYAYVPFSTRKVDGSNCVGNSVGSNGFSINVWRGRYLNGKEHDSHSFTTTYKPSDIVKCTKDEKKEDKEENREEVQLAPDQDDARGQTCGVSGCQ